MKVGDLVRVLAVGDQPIGVIVSFDSGCGWPWVVVGLRMVIWPESQLEIVDESR